MGNLNSIVLLVVLLAFAQIGCGGGRTQIQYVKQPSSTCKVARPYAVPSATPANASKAGSERELRVVQRTDESTCGSDEHDEAAGGSVDAGTSADRSPERQ